MSKTMKFEDFMKAVEDCFYRCYGFSYLDIPDFPYYDCYSAGESVLNVVEMAMEAAGYVE